MSQNTDISKWFLLWPFVSALSSGVVLRAEKHTVSGRVTAVEKIPDLQVVVHTPSELKTIALAQADTQVP